LSPPPLLANVGGVRTLVLLLALLLAAPAVASAAPPVSVPVPSDADALAYAPGHVMWATHTLHGPVVVHQAPGGVLATIPRAHPASDDLAVSLAANAGGYAVAVRDSRLGSTDECECDNPVSQGELVARGGYDGTLSTPVRCAPPRDNSPDAGLQVAAGPSGFAVSGVLCGAAAVDTIGEGGALTPLPGVTAGAISYAEPFLATNGTARGAPRGTVVHVFDTSAGTRRDLPDAPEWHDGNFQVLPDGSLLVGSANDPQVPNTLYLWAPGATAPRALAGTSDYAVAGAGRALFYRSGTADAALGLIGLDGSGLRTVGAPGAGATRVPLYVDATTAAFTSYSCQGHAQVTTVDLTDATPPTAPNGCPVLVGDSTVTFDRKGRGTLHVTCPNGCRTPLQLNIDLEIKQVSRREINRYVDKVFDSRLADAKLRFGASPAAHSVPVRLVRPARALLRRHDGRLRVFPSLGPAGAVIYGPELPLPLRDMTARLRR
jgi:hypothetical protein